MKGQDASTAHAVLQYTISRAMLEGKVGDTEILIPMSDMLQDEAQISLSSEAMSLVLKVKISTSWTTEDESGKVDKVKDAEELLNEEDRLDEYLRLEDDNEDEDDERNNQ